MQRLFLSICVVGFLRVTAAVGSPNIADSLFVEKLHHIEITGKKLKIAYVLPCGTKKLGFIAQEELGELRLAALFERSPIICADMPIMITESVDFIHYGRVKRVVKMSPQRLRGRLKMNYIQELYLGRVPGKKRQRRIEAVHSRSCNKFAGYVFQKNIDGKLELAFLDVRYRKSNGGRCKFQQDIKSFNFLRASQMRQARPMSPKVDLAKAYDLKILPTVKMNFDGKQHRLQVHYRRRCNEAPIGIVMSNADAEMRVAKVGVLVARFFNKRCEPGEPRYIADRLERKNMDARQGYQFVSMRKNSGFAQLRVDAPHNYRFVKKNGRRQFVLNYMGGCVKQAAVVYSTNGGQDSIGIVSKTMKLPCKKPAKEVSLYQSAIRLGATRKETMYPMRVKEQVYY